MKNSQNMSKLAYDWGNNHAPGKTRFSGRSIPAYRLPRISLFSPSSNGFRPMYPGTTNAHFETADILSKHSHELGD